LGVRDRIILECEQALSDTPEVYDGPLAEMGQFLVSMLAPQSLSPQDKDNALLKLERAFQNGIAELEQAGHRADDLTVYAFVHRLDFLEKKQPTSNS
jgi:hypothetical protein